MYVQACPITGGNRFMYSCTSTSTGSGYLCLYLYICMHARSATLHAGARKRAREILYAFPIQAVEIGTEPIKNNRSMFRPDRLPARTD